jgi:hypothetical protein
MKKLANPDNPQVVVINNFVDVRERKELVSKHVNPISVHKIKVDIAGNLEEIVTNAFKDGFIKSGFNVPMVDEQIEGSPFFNVSGKIKTYKIVTKSKWSTARLTAIAEVEVTIVDQSGQQNVFLSEGHYLIESRGTIGWDAVGPALDKALQKCVANLFKDEEFLRLLE